MEYGLCGVNDKNGNIKHNNDNGASVFQESPSVYLFYIQCL